jgi:hypothetical protein
VDDTSTEDEKCYPARLWMIEQSLPWPNRYRRLLICWEKKVENYLGLVHFVCCLSVYRMIGVFG